MTLVVPVDVCIRRYYRAYARVEENATDAEIIASVKEAIERNQDRELMEDTDLEIESDDFEWFEVDHDAEWTEEV